MAKWVAAAAKARAGLLHAVLCRNVTGSTKERIAQNKRGCAGLLVVVDSPQMARTCILQAFALQMSCRLPLVLRFRFVSFSSYVFIGAAALRSIVLRYASAPTATHVSSFYPFDSYEMSFFQSIFVPLPFSCFVWRVRRTFFPSGWCFSAL